MWSIFGSKPRDPRHVLGRKAEKLAVQKLRAEGHRILATNYAFQGGEIDIISRLDEMIVFTEVRARADGILPEATVNIAKQRRICRTAQYYLQQQTTELPLCRFDVIAVRVAENGSMTMVHYEDAFRA